MLAIEFLVLLLGLSNYFSAAVSNESNETAEILWNLSKLVLKPLEKTKERPLINIQSRQNYGFLAQNPHLGHNIATQPQSVAEVLGTIAVNDELHCIPRLLCEITSGSASSTGAKAPSVLPFNLDMGSLQQVLSIANFADVSPILSFGKAVLLGFTSKGDSNQCIYSYPRCPRDSDRLVDYLNNYNGGFFRFFNGLNPAQQLHAQQNYRPQFYPYNPIRNVDENYKRLGKNIKHGRTEQRILASSKYSPADYNSFDADVLEAPIKFPADYFHADPEPIRLIYQNEAPKTLVFPDYSDAGNREIFKGSYRKQKGFSFPADEDNELIFQKPLPNYPATPALFPDRTGTGELIIDSAEFEDNSEDNAFYFSHFDDANRHEYRGK